MPFKSEAQRRKMYELEKQGKVKPGTAAAWEKETPKGKLPNKVGKSRSKPAPEPASSYTRKRFSK